MVEGWATLRNFLQGIWVDLRYASRWLWRSPGFTVAAIVTIALGIGVNAGIFTVLNGLLFRNVEAPDPHELVSIYQSVQGVPDSTESAVGVFSTFEYHAYRDRSQTLSGVLARGPSPENNNGWRYTSGDPRLERQLQLL